MKMKEFFADPSRWTQRAFARDKDGNVCSTESPNATSFCLLGAVHRCYIDHSDAEYQAIYDKIRNKIGITVGYWNDLPDRTIEDIQNLCNELDI